MSPAHAAYCVESWPTSSERHAYAVFLLLSTYVGPIIAIIVQPIDGPPNPRPSQTGLSDGLREVKSSRMCVRRCFFIQILRRRSGRPDPLRDHVVHCYSSWPPGCKTFSVLSEDTGLSSKSQTRRPIVAIIVSYALIGRRLCLGGASSSASTPSGSLTASRRPPASTTAYGRAGGLDHLGHAAPSSPSRPH